MDIILQNEPYRYYYLGGKYTLKQVTEDRLEDLQITNENASANS